MTVSKYQYPGDIAISSDATAREWMRRVDAAMHVFERRMLWFAPHQVIVGSPQPDLAVELEPGHIWDGAVTLTEVARQIVGGFTVPSAGAVRIDRVVVDGATGVASRIAGVEAIGSPSAQPPALTSGKLPICQVRITSDDSAIYDEMLTDERTFKFLNMVDAVDFDGSNDYMTRGAGLTGAADSKSGILSFWVRIDGGDGTLQRIICTTNALGGGSAALQFRVAKTAGNVMQVVAADAGGTVGTMVFSTVDTFLASATWRHVLAAWDVSTGTMQLYVDDADSVTGASSTNTTHDYTGADAGIGANPDGTSKLNGCLAELYFAPGQYLDISIEANRRKFIKADGTPAPLGDGSVPTGVAPLIYQRLRKGEAASNFATNRGTGGNFTITGALDVASTSPSD